MLDSPAQDGITRSLLVAGLPRVPEWQTDSQPGAQIAQLVEQRIENPRVRGSNPRLGTTFPQ